jgi:hypothetical protein
LRKFIKNNVYVLIALNIFLFSDFAYPQTTASAPIRCSILIPVNLSSIRNLDFGINILPGIINRVDKASMSSGMFIISGKASGQIMISFSLPEYIISGKNKMPLYFSDTDGCFRKAPGIFRTFNPRLGAVTTLGKDGKIELFLGGGIFPQNNQQNGFYKGTITVNLFHVGN